MARKNLALFFVVVLIGAVALHGMEATYYTVGDSLGWENNIPNTTYYNNWASNKNFVLGDTLVFNFVTGSHDVAEVPLASYTNCIGNNNISISTIGPVSLTLNSTGMHYYICLYTGHCGQGQKLNINVSGSPSSGSTLSPPPPPPPPSSSSASTMFSSLALMLVSVAMGFLCYFEYSV